MSEQHQPEDQPRGTIADLLPPGAHIPTVIAELGARLPDPPEHPRYAPASAYQQASLLTLLLGQKAQAVLDTRPCLSCAAAHAGELNAAYEHPIFPDLDGPTAWDTILDRGATLFPLVAGDRDLAAVASDYADALAAGYAAACDTPGCPGAVPGHLPPTAARAGEFSITLLGMWAGWLYDERTAEATGPALHSTYDVVLAELLADPRTGTWTIHDVAAAIDADPRMAAAAVPAAPVAPADWSTLADVYGWAGFNARELAELTDTPLPAAVAATIVAITWLTDQVNAALAG